MTEPAVLVGGPQDGRTITATKANTIEAAFMLPQPIVTESPRPRWWQHPVQWLRWKPPPPPEPPKMIQLQYVADGTMDNGRRVFRLASPWQPYRGPDAQDDGNLYKALIAAMCAVHPVIRQDPAARWVMNRNWWERVRREPATSDYRADDIEPSSMDVLFGIRVSVTADGGAPHLENPRYPQGWPGGGVRD